MRKFLLTGLAFTLVLATAGVAATITEIKTDSMSHKEVRVICQANFVAINIELTNTTRIAAGATNAAAVSAAASAASAVVSSNSAVTATASMGTATNSSISATASALSATNSAISAAASKLSATNSAISAAASAAIMNVGHWCVTNMLTANGVTSSVTMFVQ